MSRLRELRLHGFKSFADPTRFVFEPGVTAVIGPNGSGKSNMADAIRWVLGEQSNRSLRTRRADDVIFAGSDARKPVGLAEAVLVLDNTDGWLPIDFEEVAISRRTYRSGETEYLINGARSRLRDVTDLLAGGSLGANELVVVGQGTVDAALSLRPEERRQLFEEAAGVKGLQVRRNESLARLAKARDNLSRVADLVGELRPQVRRLAAQAAHQQEHAALVARARMLADETFRRREQAARALLADSRRRLAHAEAELVAGRQTQGDRRSAVVAAERAYWDAEAAARSASQAWEVAREAAIRLESRLEAGDARLRSVDAEIRRLESEREALDREPTPAGAVGLGAQRHAAAAALAEAEAHARLAADALQAVEAAALEAEGRLTAHRQQVDARAAQTAAALEARQAATARRNRLAGEREQSERDLADAQRAALEAGRAVAEAEARAATSLAACTAGERALDEARREEAAARALVATLEERIRVLRADLDARQTALSADGISPRLRDEGWPALAATLAAARPEARRAVEAVVGPIDEAFGWEAGRRLPETAGSGVARLLASDGVPQGRAAALAAVGATQSLDEFAALGQAPTLLRTTVVAADRETLLAGWQLLPTGWLAVTPAGDLADGRGMLVIRGAARAASAGETVERLAEQLAALEDELQAASADAHRAEERLGQASTVSDSQQVGLQAATGKLRAAQAGHEAARTAEARFEDRLREVSDLLADADTALAEAGPSPADEDAGERSALVEAVQAARAAVQQAMAERDRRYAAWKAARAAWEAAEDAVQQAMTAPALQAAALAQADGRLAALRADRELTLAAREADQQSLEEASAVATAADEARRIADARRETARSALLERERTARAEEGGLADLERVRQEMAVAVARNEDALAGLERERELSVESLPPLEDRAVSDGDWVRDLGDDELEVEFRKSRRTLGQIGSVNPFAVSEHAEVAARLADVEAQQADLEAAIQATEELGARLAQDISDRFQAAFTAIGQRFEQYCQLLFAGGSASLELSEGTDGEAPGGIEIAVRPPGKRLQRLALLSGGERALTGVALLFAMLSVNPVPFCVLDEVDAALDEANIGRFADALRRLAADIDFVVITHSRATIETADTIYGVTMTDAAVSRVVSLRLADVPLEVAV